MRSSDWKNAFLDHRPDVFDEDWGGLDDISKVLGRAHDMRQSPSGDRFGECQSEVWDSAVWPFCPPPGIDPGYQVLDNQRIVEWRDGKLTMRTGFGHTKTSAYFHFGVWKKTWKTNP